ncbi:glycoside hydrolase family 1 protein [Streptomyces sp. WAC01280]|uniref:glycoside hydrolase family 1 protein n=1 Tax=Streptomyces sp. WAC01280 TaxID=2487424 RepID=UPI000F7AE668|nr:family 1 glycosylhydrolase [Streptomyces sp. WAC01280]RSS56751.1 glycosyl hydrolase family protein [Streptomyces sp. WAC01280]
MDDLFTLPDGFLWGASTSAHQTEGGNTRSDWWAFEHSGLTDRIEEPSGSACDSYHRWPEDMDLLAGLGFTDYRFSIEWARIEPSPGEFSAEALAHYRRMVEGARERGLRPMITLHHFTAPLWFTERGGWAAAESDELFARYVEAAAPVFAEGVDHVCTINEPNMVAVMATGLRTVAAGGSLPAVGLPSPDEATTEGLVRAHRRAVDSVKSCAPHVRTGWSVANQICRPEPGCEERAATYQRPRETVFLEAARGDDWLGVQAYTRTRIDASGPLPVPEDAERTLSGWEYDPQALGAALRHTAATVAGTPLIVTENGIATADDDRRIAYTSGALAGLAHAVADGVDVRGYFHWSALDNYEWGSYRPTFGLIAVDRHSFVRTPKPSAAWLGAVGRTRVLPTAAAS